MDEKIRELAAIVGRELARRWVRELAGRRERAQGKATGAERAGREAPPARR